MSAGKGNVSVIRGGAYRSGCHCAAFWRLLLDWVMLCGVLAPCALQAAAEDDYLRAIEAETEKLEHKRSVAAGDSDRGSSRRARKKKTASTGKGLHSGLSLEGFEQQLSDNYTGSAVFYRKLSRRSQEEVYGQYLNGASMPEIRSRIMKRFLNRE